MKRVSKVMAILGSSMMLASPVLAAASGREDSSNVLIYAFLGICGLIIFLQMVPVLSLVYGLVKGAFSQKETLEEEMETATSKYQ